MQYMPSSDFEEPSFDGLERCDVPLVSLQESKFDLTFHFTNKSVFLVEYMTELFDESSVEQFVRSLVFLLTKGLSRPKSRVLDLPLLGEKDITALKDVNRGAIRPEFLDEPLVHQVFEQIAERHPDRICLIFGNEQLTFEEVDSRANFLANFLIKAGVKEEVIVGVHVERSFELVIGILAILKAGGGYLPLDPSYPADRLSAYVEDAKAAIVLTQARNLKAAEKLASVGDVEVIPIDEVDLFHSNTANPGHNRCNSESTSLILFTSGSTGRPKGVQHAHRHLRDLLFSYRDFYKIGPNDVIMLTNTISFDVHTLQLFAPLMFGSKLVVVEPDLHTDGGHIVSLWWQHKVTGMIFTVPFLANEYLNSLELLNPPYPYMRMWGMGGDAVPLDIVHRMQKLCPNIEGPVNSCEFMSMSPKI